MQNSTTIAPMILNGPMALSSAPESPKKKPNDTITIAIMITRILISLDISFYMLTLRISGGVADVPSQLIWR
ncbi:MAG: hypothetical protein AAF434_13760 [Pseudomonadota bacterium]